MLFALFEVGSSSHAATAVSTPIFFHGVGLLFEVCSKVVSDNAITHFILYVASFVCWHPLTSFLIFLCIILRADGASSMYSLRPLAFRASSVYSFLLFILLAVFSADRRGVFHVLPSALNTLGVFHILLCVIPYLAIDLSLFLHSLVYPLCCCCHQHPSL